MAKQTFIWTALPNGMENGKLKLSVIMSPRLTSTSTRPTLAEFPDLIEWPSTPVEFRVQFAKGPTLSARRVGPAPDPGLWKALFPQNDKEFTYVRSYEDERATSTVVSYPVSNVVGYIEDRYRKLALEYATRLPPASRLLDPDYFGDIRLRGGLKAQLKQMQAQMRREQATMVAQAMAAAAAAGAESQPRQDRDNKPITPPPDSSTGGRDSSPLPTGLEEHIRGTIDENRQQVGQQISRGFGDFGSTDASAPLPDAKPAKRQGSDVPEELPIYFPIDTAPDPLRDFLKAGLFHLGLTPEFSGDPDDREAQPMPMLPDFDFHQMVGMLLDHPSLARQLGIIVDLEVDLTPDVPNPSSCRVQPVWSPKLGNTSNVSPWTHYEIRNGRFTPRARPTNPDVRDGMLNLADREAFALIQTDPDSAANDVLKRINAWLDPSKPDEDAALPALHSAGIGLARSGAGILLLQTFVTNRLYNEKLESKPDQIAFWAEDLVQGYRPDVWWKEKGRWYSLTGRVGTYRFLRTGQTEEIEEEGWVSLAATGGVSSAATDLHLHELLFNWSGWSLATPPVEPADEDDEGEDPAKEPGTPMQLDVEFVPPAGSLPMLRFGNTYRIRARAVDLAGNSLPFDPNDDEETGSSEEITYRRLEPVGSPSFIAPAPPWVAPEDRTTETPKVTLPRGDLVNRLVVRTYSNGTYEYESEEQPTPEYEDGSRRHIAPPRGSLKQGELHGVFDTPAGLDRYRYSDAADHDGVFQQYEPNVNASLPVPYCPDPLARYVCFQGLPGMPSDQVLKVPLGNTKERWPYLNTIRITARVGTGTPVYHDATRELVVYIPQYGEYEVKVSSGFDEADLDLMYLWHLMIKDQTPEKVAELREAAVNGQHWMLTPATTLTLVHATQRPKVGPEFITAMAHRKAGQTAAMLSGRIQVDAQSTQSIQVYATWSETYDDEGADGPMTREGDGFAFEERVRGQNVLDVYHRQEWGDTRYRKVYYQAVGTSRFAEYFARDARPEILSDADAFRKEGPAFAVDVLSTAPPAALQVEYIVPTFGWEKPKETKGDQIVSMRKGGGLRVYVRRPWFSSGDGEMLGVILSEELESGRVPKDQRHYVTHWGKDPLWQADAPDRSPKIEHFQNAAASQRGLEVNGTRVAVVGYPVHYDEERKLWYADIELDVARAYFPFIRLALARYQPKAVAGCHLSDVVLTDFLQVVPDRATSVSYKSAGELLVTVNGETYDAGPAGPAVVEVTVESTAEEGETLSWAPCEGLSPVTLVRRRGNWSGTVLLPEDRAGKRFRLIVSEYEQHVADSDPEKPDKLKIGKRLVFADVIEV